MATTTTTSDTPTPSAATAVSPVTSSIPKVLTRSFLVLDIQTDAWLQIFADRIVVGVSQLNRKVGTYLLCEAETNEINPQQCDYRLSTLLGNREDAMLGVYARTITERIRAFHVSENESNNNSSSTAGTELPKEVLLAVSLDQEKGRDPKMFQLLVGILVDMYVDAIRDTTDKA